MTAHRSLPKTLFLAGPTAVGKSEVALGLAEAIDAEIISVDSMQVYRGMDIGTAKPSPAQRQRIRHHLIDVQDPAVPFDAAQFQTLAHEALREIHQRGKRALFCGGTGLYFKAFLYGMDATPPTSSTLRDELEQRPLPDLLQELEQIDPIAYDRIDRNNPRRVVRALEIVRLTGQPLETFRHEWAENPTPDNRILALNRERPDLVNRINARVDKMFAAGLIDETGRLLEQGLENNPTASKAIGYQQAIDHLKGECSTAEAIETVKIRTRQYARRQITWFRNQLYADWIPVKSEQPAQETIERILVSACPQPGE